MAKATQEKECLQETLQVGNKTYRYYALHKVEGWECLPYALRIVTENILRNAVAPDGAASGAVLGAKAGASAESAAAHEATGVRNAEYALSQAAKVVAAARSQAAGEEIEFMPARVLFQDFTGVPAFVDYASMRDAAPRYGIDPERINPLIPCNLVIDHSVIADRFGVNGAEAFNKAEEMRRNSERYSFLQWAKNAFDNVDITPPGVGICHQMNIEKFASVVMTSADEVPVAYFDTLVGTDSHTPTANGLGVLGWGVGGIEAEAASLGQPITTQVPAVYGVRLTGAPRPGVSGMDIALTFAQVLRNKGVVGAFVECFGEGVANLSATVRACIANMTPEYGSTCTLFPVDDETLSYLRLTGRSEEHLALIRAYTKAQGLFVQPDEKRLYKELIDINLNDVVPSMAGPSRPHDRRDLCAGKEAFRAICEERGLDFATTVQVGEERLTHGAIAIAAVTSCTTATDPAMMMTAGLVAAAAAARGAHAAPWVKTIFAPGSHAVTRGLEAAGLLQALGAVGFTTCGYGCMSCIGNSGAILPEMHDVASTIELASVLSGNRNFEGRISPDVAQNYLMAPAYVIAYALAGTMDVDIEHDALCLDAAGKDVYLRDLMPSEAEVAQAVRAAYTPELFLRAAEDSAEGANGWQGKAHCAEQTYMWDERSTYVRRAPFFDQTCDAGEVSGELAEITGARVLAKLGDFITTDHISPAGAIALNSPAAAYLRAHGVEEAEFNTYGSRRGNHEVMMRGTFANVKLQNALAENKRGGWTRNNLSGEITSIYEAAMDYRAHGVPSIILAGKMYGSGSSRDWAGKGPALLGVRAVIAESFERIHRSNLVGMGILPLQYMSGENAESLGLDGTEEFTIHVPHYIEPDDLPLLIGVEALKRNGERVAFRTLARIDTATEISYYREGGILPYVLKKLAQERS